MGTEGLTEGRYQVNMSCTAPSSSEPSSVPYEARGYWIRLSSSLVSFVLGGVTQTQSSEQRSSTAHADVITLHAFPEDGVDIIDELIDELIGKLEFMNVFWKTQRSNTSCSVLQAVEFPLS